MHVAFHTLGCKLNQAETSAIGAGFRGEGHEVVSLQEACDVVVINSCSVTESADKECRKIIRRALRHNPDTFVVVTGCYAQLRPEEVASIDGVDLVLGSAEKHRTLFHVGDGKKRDAPRVFVSEIAEVSSFGPAHTNPSDGRARAFLKVQDGCDYSCTFCTIPRARGTSRSQSIEASLHQARALVRQGFAEIVLTGVNVGDFGRKEGTNFYALLNALHEVEGLKRLKVSSIEPNLLSEEILDLAARSDRLMPHFHIPLQSGSDRVLSAMRRRYQSTLYAERVRGLLDRLPHCAIGVDVIVGFPGETDAEFSETMNFLMDLPIAYLHAFTYSEREDTPAAALSDVIPRAERRLRTQRLRELSDRKLSRFLAAHVGTVRPVLFEKVLEDGRLTGLTDNYIRVDVPASPLYVGQIHDVALSEGSQARLNGMLSPPNNLDAAADAA